VCWSLPLLAAVSAGRQPYQSVPGSVAEALVIIMLLLLLLLLLLPAMWSG
jgi:hypothetical protein